MTGEAEHGTPVAHVQVEIDYAILQHFSQHLYSSPNKAVEELVTNGYDALASDVQVFLPGAVTEDSVIVWDDGDSMDIDGLRRLWWIARSPKENGTERIAVSSRRGITRAMIGKFGIGKLASYAVGERISHLCHRDSKYYLIAVDYNLAPRIEKTSATRARGFRVPVMELTKDEARTFAKALFRNVPPNFGKLWRAPSWTLAIVGQLKQDVKLTPGRLRWVLGNGMPSRPDFSVSVDSEKVTPKIESDPIVDWDASEPMLQDRLRNEWSTARNDGIVVGDIAFATDDEGRPTVITPTLGDMRIRVRLFKRSLYKRNQDDAGRSEGFFILVRERLLNPDDPKLLLPDPSFGAFNRMQIYIWADGLDKELLADRERLHRTTPGGAELETLQKALYREARLRIVVSDTQPESGPTISGLPIVAREIIHEPLTALIMNSPGADLGEVDPSKTRLAVESGGSEEALMRFDVSENRLVTNTDHPLFESIAENFGSTQKAREAQKLVEMFAIADQLLKGHLLDVGIDEDLVDRIMEWRDAQLRSLSIGVHQSADLVIKEVDDTSYKGSKPFEDAIAKLFRLMGFVAERDGRAGQKDILVVAPVGQDESRFTVEAKGSKKAVVNDAAEISGAASHAGDVGAAFSLVVAREFVGFTNWDGGSEPAVLRECRQQRVPVTIVTVECLVELYQAVQKHQYPLAMIVDRLREIEPPGEKLKRIAEMRDPLSSGIDWRGVLDSIWDLQQGTASKSPVATLQVQQMREEWKEYKWDSFEQMMVGLESLTGGLLALNTKQHTVNLHQAPDLVAERVSSRLSNRS